MADHKPPLYPVFRVKIETRRTTTKGFNGHVEEQAENLGESSPARAASNTFNSNPHLE